MDSTEDRIMIEAVCKVTTDRGTLRVAEWVKMKPEGRAAQYLHHYLDGWGGTEYIDTATLLREDTALLKIIEKNIQDERMKGPIKRSGQIPLSQLVFSNQDWKMATGSLNMDWQFVSEGPGFIEVELSFRNKYRWHPNEARVTQCLHQAAERLKKSGAQEFLMVGRPTKIRVPYPGR